MTRPIKTCVLLTTAILLTLVCSSESRAAAWQTVEGELVSIEDAKKYYASKALKIGARVKALSVAPSSTGGDEPPVAAAEMIAGTYPAEIVQLAKGLGNDPLAIFNYVRNNIDYVPYWGLRKGGLGCLLDGNGNDFDQSALLIALLRSSGYDAEYLLGTMIMSNEVLGNWFKVASDSNIVSAVLANNGIISSSHDASTWNVGRVWVTVNVEGVDYQLDAAYKTHTNYKAIDLSSMMGYDRESFLSAVRQGATVTTDYVQNLNDANLTSKLTEYAMNLAQGLRTSHPNAETAQILGGSQIIQTQITSLARGLFFPASMGLQWQSVPLEYMDTFRVQLHSIDHTFEVWQLFGKRLTITFEPSALRPQLRLDGDFVAEGNSASSGQGITGTFSIDHPLAGQGGTYTDQESDSYFVAKPSHVYAVVVGNTSGGSDRAIRQSEGRLALASKQGLPETSENVRGEMLHIAGMRWLRQRSQTYFLSGQVTGVRKYWHHSFGVVSFTDGIAVDWIAGSDSRNNTRHGLTYEDNTASSFTGWATGSGYEHAIMEQLYAGTVPGGSSIKVLWKANMDGSRVFLARSANFAWIKPLLGSYGSTRQDRFQQHVDDGGFILLGESGNVQINDWTGNAWIGIGGIDTVNGYMIGGGLNGGYAATTAPPKVTTINEWINDFPDFKEDSGLSMEGPASMDPVDLKSGYWFTDTVDLRLGSGVSPDGLLFARNYNSGSADIQGGLGHAWRHNNDIFVAETSSGVAVSGGRSAVDAVAYLTYLYVVTDIFKELVGCPWGDCPEEEYDQDVLGQMILVMGCKWYIDQTVNNIARVSEGASSQEYVKLPDGSYNSPAGIATVLTKEADGTFKLTERNGTVRSFNQDNQIASVVDIDGNQATYTYSDGKLVEVKDAYNRTLSLVYAGELLTSVTDSTGRSISFAFDINKDLTSYTDPDGHVWPYEYAQHRLTKMLDPAGDLLVTNFYNDLNQVDRQQLPRQTGVAEYQFLFGEYRSVEIDPSGNRTTYLYDSRDRNVAVIDALGQREEMEYDGQNHLVKRVDKRGNVTRTEFDGRHNPIKIIDAHGDQTQMTYDNKDQLVSVTDSLGNTLTNLWNDKYKIVKITDPTGRSSDISYDARGRVATRTDASGVVTAMGYDAFGNAISTKVGTHPAVVQSWDPIGRMLSLTDQKGAKTIFEYDDRGNITKKTDPLNRVSNYVFDSRGRMTSRTNRKNEIVSYDYSPTGKMLKMTLPGSEEITYAYDIHDRLVLVTESMGATAYTYDALHRRLSRTDVHGLKVGQSYDAVGNIKSVTYPDGEEVTYSYDVLNRLVKLRQWLGDETEYDYDSSGRMTWRKAPGGIATFMTYDTAGRLASKQAKRVDNSLVSNYALTYDQRGFVSTLLTEQPVKPVMAPKVDVFTYNPNGYQIETINGFPMVSDNEGQLASMGNGAETFQFDARGRLVARTNPSITYKYDYSGNRVSRTEAGIQKRFLYDLNGNMLAEMDGANMVQRQYVYGVELDQTIDVSGEVSAYHSDYNGNITAITDTSGEVTHGYAYTPFGEILNRMDYFPQPFAFVGGLGVMQDVDLAYMRARYYDSQTGRFVSEDPLGFQGDGPNLFVYAVNDPLLKNDPLGMASSSEAASMSMGGAINAVVAYGLTKALGSDFFAAKVSARLLMTLRVTAYTTSAVAGMYFMAAIEAAEPTAMGGLEGERTLQALKDYDHYGDFVQRRFKQN